MMTANSLLGAGSKGHRANRGVQPRFAIILGAQAFVAASDTVVVIALPSIGRDLRLSPMQSTWVLNAYILALGSALLLGGRWADRFGRRRLFGFGLAIFGVCSLIAAGSVSPLMLIAARAVQGVGGGLATPAAMALISDLFPDGPQRVRALAWFAGVGGLAGSAGGIVGGVLTAMSWRLPFLLAGCCLVLLSTVPLLPEGRRSAAPPAPLGAALLGVTSVVLVLGACVRFGATGTVTVTDVLLVCAAVAAGIGVVLHIRTAKNPLIPRSLVHTSGTAAGWVAMALAGAHLFGGFLLMTLYLQVVHGLATVPAALWQLPLSVVLFAGSQAGTRLAGRWGAPRTLLLGGCIQATALGTGAAGLFPSPDRPLPLYLVPAIGWALGLGITLVTAFTLSTRNAADETQGVAAGVANTALQVGGAIGVALFTVLAVQLAASDSTITIGGVRLALLGASALALGTAGIGAATAIRLAKPRR